jgi:hypothetical protein
MCPVHSAGRQHLGHPACGVPVHFIAKQYARAAKCTMPIHHHSYVAKEASPARQYYVDRGYQGARKIALATSISRSKYYICYVPGPTCRGSASLYVPPLYYKREGMLCYKRRISQTHTHTRSLKLTKQYNTQWNRVLRSGGPNHSKLLRVLARSSQIHLTGKMLRPPPHLRI